ALEEPVVAGALEDAGREGALAGCDDHGAAEVAALVGGQDEVSVFPRQVLDLLAEANLGSELEALLDEVGGEVPGRDPREAADVVDVLLRVERRELAAEFGQRIDDARRHAAHAG